MKLKFVASAILALGALFSTSTFAATSLQMNDGTLGGLFAKGNGIRYGEIISARDDSGASGVPAVATASRSSVRVPLIGRLLYQRFSGTSRYQAIMDRSPLMSVWFEAIALEVDPDDEINRPEIPEIPIPASVWLFMSALGLLVGWKRRSEGQATA